MAFSINQPCSCMLLQFSRGFPYRPNRLSSLFDLKCLSCWYESCLMCYVKNRHSKKQRQRKHKTIKYQQRRNHCCNHKISAQSEREKNVTFNENCHLNFDYFLFLACTHDVSEFKISNKLLI